MFKRVALFLVTNLAVMVLLSVVWGLLQSTGIVDPQMLGGHGTLLVFAAVFGFGGAFISLLMSKPIAKWSTGAKVIEAPRSSQEIWLVETVRQQAERAGIGMPEVAVYDSPEPNAFATGATRNSSLVAVSTGLLARMERQEVEAVLAHEVSHVANGDMVTLTLIQGVVNTFVIFLARLIGGLVDGMLRRDDERSGPGFAYWGTVIVAEIFLGILASIIVAWFSRQREFRADHGGATLAGRQNMINALRRLGGEAPSELPQSLAAFGIRGGALSLLSSHPPIELRIQRLQQSGV